MLCGVSEQKVNQEKNHIIENYIFYVWYALSLFLI